MGNSSLGWQMGFGAGLLLIAVIKTWHERKFYAASLGLTMIGLYMLLQRFIPQNIETRLARCEYLAIGAILGAVSIGYLLQTS